MNCMKCGKELKSTQPFCDRCLEDMEKYPVKPNVVVQIPIRPQATSAKRKTKRQRFVRPEDELRFLRKRVRLLTFALVVSVLAFALAAAAALFLLDKMDILSVIDQQFTAAGITDTV